MVTFQNAAIRLMKSLPHFSAALIQMFSADICPDEIWIVVVSFVPGK